MKNIVHRLNMKHFPVLNRLNEEMLSLLKCFQYTMAEETCNDQFGPDNNLTAICSSDKDGETMSVDSSECEESDEDKEVAICKKRRYIFYGIMSPNCVLELVSIECDNHKRTNPPLVARELEELRGQDVTTIATDGCARYALTKTGDVWIWKPFAQSAHYKPWRAFRNATTIKCTAYGMFALDKAGQVWQFDAIREYQPTLRFGSNGQPTIGKLECGSEHILMLTTGGQVRGWGFDENSPVPLEFQPSLEPKKLLVGAQAQRIACGDLSSAVLTTHYMGDYMVLLCKEARKDHWTFLRKSLPLVDIFCAVAKLPTRETWIGLNPPDQLYVWGNSGNRKVTVDETRFAAHFTIADTLAAHWQLKRLTSNVMFRWVNSNKFQDIWKEFSEQQHSNNNNNNN